MRVSGVTLFGFRSERLRVAPSNRETPGELTVAPQNRDDYRSRQRRIP